MEVQQLRLKASTARGVGSIPDQGIKVPHFLFVAKKKESSQYPGPECDHTQKDSKTRKGMQEQDTALCLKFPSPRLPKRNC